MSLTSLLGAEHEDTLRLVTNLPIPLSQCGQETEGEQTLRGTLVAARRALGPTHDHTQNVLECMRVLGLAEW